MQFARFRGRRPRAADPAPPAPPTSSPGGAARREAVAHPEDDFLRKRRPLHADNDWSMPRTLYRRPDGPSSLLPAPARPPRALLLAAMLLAPLVGCSKGTPVSPHIAPVDTLVIQPRIDTL